MSKYNSVRTEVSGISFASKKEASRYSELALLERAGEISDLKLQVPFRLEVNGIFICKFISDFVYIENGKEVVEDSKGFRTHVYRLKKKLMLAVHGVDIKES